MNIGSLYTVKAYRWLLFPSLETAMIRIGQVSSFTFSNSLAANREAAWVSEHLNCNVTCVSSGSYIIFLEEDGRYKKVLTSDGRIGWTWINKNDDNCFQELKS